MGGGTARKDILHTEAFGDLAMHSEERRHEARPQLKGIQGACKMGEGGMFPRKLPCDPGKLHHFQPQPYSASPGVVYGPRPSSCPRCAPQEGCLDTIRTLRVKAKSRPQPTIQVPWEQDTWQPSGLLPSAP